MRGSQVSAFLLASVCALHPWAAAESVCVIDPESTVSDACASYASLDQLNKQLGPALQDVTENTDFFSYYRLNLYSKVCPFWRDESSVCGNRACAVDTIEDETAIPKIWRAEELSKLEGMRAQHPGPEQQKARPKKRPLQYELGENVDETCVLENDDECDERDYCLPEDEGVSAKGDYVSLVNNTERFTGYSGPGAHQVWDAIYRENCFAPANSPLLVSSNPQAASALQNVIQGAARHVSPDVSGSILPLDECLEQRAFYRVISGMHTSISTHLCWEYFNQKTGEWFHNVTCYKDRLHNHPERISNLYFNFALVTRAVAKLQRHLESYTFCSGDPDLDYETKHKVLALASRASAEPNTFDESVMFNTPELLDLKDSFKQRFRNVSRLMDCVGCDKCRLWGKVQTGGYGAALKVLFEFDEAKNGENPALRRTELVALINTWRRISHSLFAINELRALVAQEPNQSQSLTHIQGEPGVHSDDIKYVDIDDIDTNKLNRWVPDPTFGYASKSNGFNEAKLTDDPKPNLSLGETDKPANFGAVTTKPAVSNSDHNDGALDSEDDDDFEEFDLQSAQDLPPIDSRSLKEEFLDELELVWRAYKFVLNSWIQLPFTLSGIIVMELNRLWNFFIGLPVPEKSWDFDWNAGLPRRDEL